MSNAQPASTHPHPTASDALPMRERVTQAFANQIQALALHRHPYTVLQAFAEIAALTIHQSPYHLGQVKRDDAFDRIEQAYLTAIQPYSPDELAGFVKLYGLASLAFAAYPATDLLGRLYMTLGMGNKRAGQYFTPPQVARAMAAMMLHDARDHIEQKGFITLADPTCGAGGMLIEVANELHDLGYDPKQVMMAQAADHSRDCFNLAYLQLSLLNIPAMVIHGDSLSLEVWEQRPTPMLTLMTQARRLPGDPTPAPPMAAPAAGPTQNPPDIRIPDKQLRFHFDPDAEGV